MNSQVLTIIQLKENIPYIWVLNPPHIYTKLFFSRRLIKSKMTTIIQLKCRTLITEFIDFRLQALSKAQGRIVLGTYIPMQWVTKWSILPRLCQASSTWRDCNQQPVAWTRTYSYIRYLVFYCTYYMSQASEPGVAKLEITIIIIILFLLKISDKPSPPSPTHTHVHSPFASDATACTIIGYIIE